MRGGAAEHRIRGVAGEHRRGVRGCRAQERGGDAEHRRGGMAAEHMRVGRVLKSTEEGALQSTEDGWRGQQNTG